MKGGMKQMNKKIAIPVMLVFSIGMVFALGYYALFSASFTVLPSITLSEGCDDVLSNVYSGDIIEGSECIITNEAPTLRDLILSNDAAEGIDVSYAGTLELIKKDTETWVATGEPIEVDYTVIGDTFSVTGVPEGYTAIYYKDEVVGLEGRLANPQPAVSIVGVGNLPHSDDANVDELADYTQAPDFYNQMKGAKLWVVPNGDLSEGTLNWANMADYYYETDLIQYNSDGEITLYPGASLTVTPVYEIGSGVSGEQVITTTVA